MTERLFEPTDTDTRLAFQRSVLEDPVVNTPGVSHFGEGDQVEAAAARMVAPRTGTLRARILEKLEIAWDDGRTGYELQSEMGDLLYSIAPRLTELRDAGWTCDSGLRRETPSGADSIVWQLTPRGREAWNRMEEE